MSLVGTRPPTVDEYEQYEFVHTEVESLKLQEALMEAVSEKDYLYFSPRFQTKEKDFMCKCISGGIHSFRINILCKIEKF